MARPYNRFIRRGGTLTGRKLLAAFTAAGRPPSVGAGLMVSAFGQQAAITNTKRQIIPKTIVLFPAILFAFTPLPATLDRWEYDWLEAQMDSNGDYREELPGGRRFDDDENGSLGRAKNLAELQNDGLIAAHGVDLTPPPGGSVEVLPMPILTPVLLFQRLHSDGFFRYHFSEVNAVNFTCAP